MATKITTAKNPGNYKPYTPDDPCNNTEGKKEEEKPVEEKSTEVKKPVAKLPAKTTENKKLVKVPIERTQTIKKVMPKQVKKKVTVKASIKKTENDKPKRTRGDEYKLATSLIIEKKYTDDEMLSLLSKTNPERDKNQILKCISACRYFLNAGARKCYDPKKDGIIEQLIDYNGKMILRSQKPKTEKKVREKIDPAKDPLRKLGIIGKKKQEEKKLTKKTVKK